MLMSNNIIEDPISIGNPTRTTPGALYMQTSEETQPQHQEDPHNAGRRLQTVTIIKPPLIIKSQNKFS